jgi:hypothetical protein
MFFITFGVLIWFVGTIAFRLIGQFVLDPSNAMLTIGIFIAMLPLIVMMYGIYIWKQVSISDRTKVAISVALPGMLLDVNSILFFPTVFPNIDPNANGLFAALMLWGYGLILLSGFLPTIEVES